MREPVAKGHNDGITYSVEPTTAEHTDILGPVLFQARQGCITLQDYFTPDEARALGQALIDTANEVETGPQRCVHGKTAGEPCGDCLADEGLDAEEEL
jgi:hypothetical protein